MVTNRNWLLAPIYLIYGFQTSVQPTSIFDIKIFDFLVDLKTFLLINICDTSKVSYTRIYSLTMNL